MSRLKLILPVIFCAFFASGLVGAEEPQHEGENQKARGDIKVVDATQLPAKIHRIQLPPRPAKPAKPERPSKPNRPSRPGRG